MFTSLIYLKHKNSLDWYDFDYGKICGLHQAIALVYNQLINPWQMPLSMSVNLRFPLVKALCTAFTVSHGLHYTWMEECIFSRKLGNWNWVFPTTSPYSYGWTSARRARVPAHNCMNDWLGEPVPSSQLPGRGILRYYSNKPTNKLT